jgi:nucleoside-diphosphate-sugar epimerase
MEKMVILITGHKGYIGSSLVPYLKKKIKDSTIIGLDTNYFDYKTSKDVDIEINADLRKTNLSEIKKVDAVINLSAISNDPIGNKFSNVTEQINFKATEKLIKLVKKKGCKNFIFASSCSIYGFGGNLIKTEKDTLNPLTTYAKSKIYIENFLKKNSNKNFRSTCLRYSTAAGVSNNIRLDLVLNDFVFAATKNKKIVILSDGKSFRPLIDVEDMCKSIHWAISRKKDKDSFLAVNVGRNENNIRVKDLADRVAKIIPGTKVVFSPSKKSDSRSYKVDFSLYKKKAPNHKISKSINRIILELHDFVKKNLLKKNLNHNKYIRLKNLESKIEKKKLSKNLYWI